MELVVRRLVPADHAVLRTLRLRSLSEAPDAYGSSYEREAAFTDADWMHRLRPDGNPHFACGAEGLPPIGIVAVARDDTDDLVAHVLGMWVDADARGTGAADALIGACLAWALDAGCARVRLHVTEGNVRAERAYVRNGFARTGTTFARERDGQVEIEMENARRHSDAE